MCLRFHKRSGKTYFFIEGDLHQLTKGIGHAKTQDRTEIREKDLDSRSDRHLNVQVTFHWAQYNSEKLLIMIQAVTLTGKASLMQEVIMVPWNVK